MTQYDLSKRFWDWAFDNTDKITAYHAAIFFFAMEHHNRLGQKDKFGFPSKMVMDSIGIGRYETYIKYFNDLCEWGFFVLVQKSKNQHTASVISFNSAILSNSGALGRAIGKHIVEQQESAPLSDRESDSSIDKLLTKNNKSTEDGSDVILEKFKDNRIVVAWQEWVKFKKEKGQTYKPVGIKKAITKLFNLSQGDSEYAVDMLDEAMSNNYQGFFKLKNREPNLNKNQIIILQKDYSALSDWDRKVQEHFDKAAGSDPKYQQRFRDFRDSYYPDCNKYELHLKFPEFLTETGRFIYPEDRPKI
jgi:hypothetical protein